MCNIHKGTKIVSIYGHLLESMLFYIYIIITLF